MLTLKGHTENVWSVAWSPDARMLATASWDETVRIYVLDTHGLLGLEQNVVVPTNSGGRESKVWDAAGGQELLIQKDHTLNLTSLAWSPDH